MGKRKKSRQKGRELFEEWYEGHWGPRWPALLSSLEEPVSHVAWWNPWTTLSPKDVLPQDAILSETLEGCWEAPSFPAPPADQNGKLAYYLLDGASVWVSQAFRQQGPADRWLDMCAAPGGKSLQLASTLRPGQQLTTNDMSRKRFQRLQNVFQSHTPASFQKEHIRLTHHDASRWCLYETAAYDRVLIDVPCSSERHLLHAPQELAKWTPARSRQLAFRQYAILASALEVVAPEGLILYSTCSISPLECDDVLTKLHKKKPQRVEPIELSIPFATQTEWGYWITPDQSPWGPIYLALMRRIT